MCSRVKSSFSGKIAEIPGIAVDNFEQHNLKSQAFFLSHCHSDHTKGLFTPELVEAVKYNEITIYTSELSKAIINDDCNGDEVLMERVKSLNSGTTHIRLPGVFGYEEEYLRVTVISAGHCLGSVMFLFETKDKQTILYTGDFNISSNDLPHMIPFRDNNKEPIHIDVMYIDTTFISNEYEYFPKRHTVVKEMITFIGKWLKADQNNRVALNTSAKYGYEYVFHQIKKMISLKVFVSEERWRFYSKHEIFKDCFTNKEENTKIHICRDFSEKGSHKSCSISGNQHYKYLFIRLSAMKWSSYTVEESAIKQLSTNRLDVCFPTHCSRTEIINFVNYFSPRKVVGFPNKYTQPEQKRKQESQKVIPKKRKMSFKKTNEMGKKVDKEILKLIFD